MRNHFKIVEQREKLPVSFIKNNACPCNYIRLSSLTFSPNRQLSACHSHTCAQTRLTSWEKIEVNLAHKICKFV